MARRAAVEEEVGRALSTGSQGEVPPVSEELGREGWPASMRAEPVICHGWSSAAKRCPPPLFSFSKLMRLLKFFLLKKSSAKVEPMQTRLSSKFVGDLFYNGR